MLERSTSFRLALRAKRTDAQSVKLCLLHELDSMPS